jgi:arsenite methyltransferase
MTSAAYDPLILNLEDLRTAIQDEYACVAREPQRGFHFHTGRPLALLLDYKEEWLAGIPETAIESFAGTGQPFPHRGAVAG